MAIFNQVFVLGFAPRNFGLLPMAGPPLHRHRYRWTLIRSSPPTSSPRGSGPIPSSGFGDPGPGSGVEGMLKWDHNDGIIYGHITTVTID